jgi:hypothetical protein
MMTEPASADSLSPGRTDLKGAAKAMAAEGRYVEAIAAATALNRLHPDEELERLLVVWRIAAFAARAQTEPDPDWPPAFADPFPGLSGLPEIPAADLTTNLLAGAIIHHGALLVRGFISPDEASQLRSEIDEAFAGFAAWLADNTTAPTRWFCPAQISEFGALGKARPWTLAGGGTWAADSPHMLFKWVELLERTGIVDMVGEYMAERPALSVGKTTLRRIPASQNSTGWHQDGAFLGKGTRSVNLWLALSDCGRDASGLDLVPKRIPYIVETGTQGAVLDWLVGPGMVETLTQDAPVASPEFFAGDALLFDHFFLHRTSLPPNRSKDRWAIESWMFAPSCYPPGQGPMLL